MNTSFLAAVEIIPKRRREVQTGSGTEQEGVNKGGSVLDTGSLMFGPVLCGFLTQQVNRIVEAIDKVLTLDGSVGLAAGVLEFPGVLCFWEK